MNISSDVVLIRAARSALALASLGVYTPKAHGSVMFGSSSQFGAIYTIDQSTGSPTSFGPKLGLTLSSMASDWRADSFRLWTVGGANNRLIRIDPTTGAGTVIGVLPFSHMDSVAFDVVSGQMYATDHVALLRINVETAAATLVGTLGTTGMQGLGFDRSGTLFGTKPTDGSLWRINTSTGSATRIGSGGHSIVDIACRPEDGAMFGVSTDFTYGLYRIDTNTGEQTLVGPVGSAYFMNGLAFSPAPSPGTVLLVSVACIRRQRR